MTQKVVTKKSFIGGRLVYPGEMVDVDAKGAVLPAASTPIGQLTVDQLRDLLAARESNEPAEEYGKNVAEPTDNNTGSQPMEMAPVAPYAPGAVQSQVAPPGSEAVQGGFLHPAPVDAPAAVEEVLPPGGAGQPGLAALIGEAGEAFNADAVITGNSEDVRGRLTGLSPDQLDAVEKAEKDREVPRKGVLSAIDEARKG
jgi:hypothetical protein